MPFILLSFEKFIKPYWLQLLLGAAAIFAVWYVYDKGYMSCENAAKQAAIEAQLAQATKDKQTQSALQKIADDNQKEADDENEYSISLEKKLAEEIKKNKNPANCKPSAGRVQYINSAGKH